MDDATRIMEGNWQAYHLERKTTALTGSTLRSYFSYHGLSHADFPADSRVLEVGVGLGHVVRELAAKGCRVWAFDICSEALSSVRDVTSGEYLHRLADSLPTGFFDIITHHLVTQHMSDVDLIWQLPHLIRSLKTTGHLHIQWAGSDVPGENDIAESIVGEEGHPEKQNTPSMMGGRMVRSESHAQELIENAGGLVVEVTDRRAWPNFASSWFSMKVVRSDA